MGKTIKQEEWFLSLKNGFLTLNPKKPRKEQLTRCAAT